MTSPIGNTRSHCSMVAAAALSLCDDDVQTVPASRMHRPSTVQLTVVVMATHRCSHRGPSAAVSVTVDLAQWHAVVSCRVTATQTDRRTTARTCDLTV